MNVFFASRVEIAARLLRVRVLAVNPAQRQQRVVQVLLGHVELALAHRRRRQPILPQHPVTRRPVRDGVRRVHHDVAGQRDLVLRRRGAAGHGQQNGQQRRLPE